MGQPRSAHSPFHKIRLSECEMLWEKLLVEPNGVRVCPSCRSHIFDVAKMNEEQAVQLIRSSELYNEKKQNVLRRNDGTIIVEKDICGGSNAAIFATGMIFQVL